MAKKRSSGKKKKTAKKKQQEKVTVAKIDLIEEARKRRHLHLLKKLNKGSLVPAEIKELEGFENPQDDKDAIKFNPKALTQKEICVLLNKKAARVNHWRKMGMPVVPGSKPPRYNLADMWNWKVEYERSLALGQVPQTAFAAEKEQQDVKIKKQQVRKLTRQNDKEDKKLVKLDNVLNDMRALGQMFRTRVDASKRLLPAAKRDVLDNIAEEFVRDIQNTFSVKVGSKKKKKR